MAKKKTSKKSTSRKVKKPSFMLSNQQKLIFGSLLLIIGIYLFIAFLSFLFTGKNDQSILSEFPSRAVDADNWVSTIGANLSHFFIYKGFGVASFMFSGLIFLSGIHVLLNLNKAKLWRHWFWGTLIVIWSSILLSFSFQNTPVLGGTIGFEINLFLKDYIGKIEEIAYLNQIEINGIDSVEIHFEGKKVAFTTGGSGVIPISKNRPLSHWARKSGRSES